MTPDEADQVLRRLLAAFPASPVTADTPTVWRDVLRDVPFEPGWEAALMWERTMDKIATPHELLATARGIRQRQELDGQKALPGGRDPSLLDPEMRRKVQELSEKLRSDLRETSAQTRAKRGDPNDVRGPAGLDLIRRNVARVVHEVAASFGEEPATILDPGAGHSGIARPVALELVRLRTVCHVRDLAAMFGYSDAEAAAAALRASGAIERDPGVRQRAARAWAKAFGDAPPFAVVEGPPPTANEEPDDDAPVGEPEPEEVEA